MAEISVLIVDDDETDRYLLTRDLKRCGLEMTIFECVDGEDALQYFRCFEENKAKHGESFPPVIVFLDINMPRLTGLEFLDGFAKLRAERVDYSSCVIMMFSSSEHPDERKRAMGYEFVADFVVKGQTNRDELRAKIEGVLER